MVSLTILPVALANPYAKSVVSANILPGNNSNSYTNTTNALGVSDGVYVSMGGPGATLMVDMGADTPVTDGPGPDLEVREIGLAFGGVDENYRVLVSNSPVANSFVLAGTGRALSLIDLAPSGLTTARYVLFEDLATETLSSVSPGSDIDSIRLLHFSGSGDITPPSAVQVRITGQGVWLSWSPSPAQNVTGYAVRRSLDGVSFASTADVALSAQETAWLDVAPPRIGNYYYGVSAITAAGESRLVVVAVASSQFPISGDQAVHIGDNTIATWEDPSPQADHTITFTIPNFAAGANAELTLDEYDVDYANAVFINGARAGNVPDRGSAAAGTWVSRSLLFPAGLLQPGINTLRIEARNSSGALTGNLDDFQVRNLALNVLGSPANINIFAGVRSLQIPASQTTLTLRWIMEQTTSMEVPDWRAVSSPFQWSGEIVPDRGFFRLRELP